MAKHKILSHAETMELIVASQEGSEDAREQLVECNTRLVWSMVQRFKNRGYDPEDIFQIGCIGLLKGISKFDTSFGVKFTTYAVPMIIGEIQRFIRDDGVVKVSRTIKELASKLRVNNLVNATPEHIMEVLEVDNMDLVKTTIQYIKQGAVKSLEETVYENDGDPITIQDQLPGDANGANWFDNVALHSAFEKLTDRERKIVELRYYKDRTQTEVSNELGVSQVQVSRLEKKILDKMKELMKEENEMPYQQKGNREEAIELLKNTTLTHPEINERTGVPTGSLGALAKKYRDPAVSLANRSKFTEGKKAAISQREVTKEVKPVETPIINEPAFMGEKDLAKAQTIAVKGDEIVVIHDNGEEAFRISDRAVTTGRFPTDRPNVPNTPKSEPSVVVSIDTETTTGYGYVVEPSKHSVSFSVNVSLGGEGVSKDEALDSLKKAMDMVKLVPSETINLALTINN